MFFASFYHILFRKVQSWSVKTGRQILVVQSGPEGPQFSRFIGTLVVIVLGIHNYVPMYFMLEFSCETLV